MLLASHIYKPNRQISDGPTDLKSDPVGGSLFWRDRVVYEGKGIFSSKLTTQDIVGVDR